MCQLELFAFTLGTFVPRHVLFSDMAYRYSWLQVSSS